MTGKVLLGVQGGGEPEAEPPDYRNGVKDQVSWGDRGSRRGGKPLAGGTLVDKVCFGYGEFDIQVFPFSGEGSEDALEPCNVGSM